MEMGPDQVAMLVGGSLLFIVAVGLLVYCVVTRRSFKAVLLLFWVAIIMIGFPSITHFKILGAEVDLNRSLAAVEKNPNDPAARDRLASAVAKVSQQPALTSQSRVTLAKAQLVLGRRDEAAANLQSALKAKPNLKVDANLRTLVSPSPH